MIINFFNSSAFSTLLPEGKKSSFYTQLVLLRNEGHNRTPVLQLCAFSVPEGWSHWGHAPVLQNTASSLPKPQNHAVRDEKRNLGCRKAQFSETGEFSPCKNLTPQWHQKSLGKKKKVLLICSFFKRGKKKAVRDHTAKGKQPLFLLF